MSTSVSAGQIIKAVAFGATDAVVDVRRVQAPITVTVVPGSGCTCIAEYSTTPSAVATPAGATWFPWTPGSVTAAASDVIGSRVVAIRGRRTVGSASCSLEVCA